ncbi:hypothetical protein NDU88_007756 [Pleurodeles waltl]|uniref:Uncharacterized protein n=1 Tax=Pleurodeles waltl TaxID=8319 RepID=A0AAV7N6S7_PLEWA|nr:hypothetical protein NDU88_007756 [Pleurodeles waltl]
MCRFPEVPYELLRVTASHCSLVSSPPRPQGGALRTTGSGVLYFPRTLSPLGWRRTLIRGSVGFSRPCLNQCPLLRPRLFCP